MAPLSTKLCVSGAGGCAAYPRAFTGRQVVARNVRGHVAAVEAPNAVNEEVSIDDMYDKFKALLEQTPTRHRRDDVVRGTVISADRRGAYVDIGGKGAAFVPTDALTTAPISDAREIVRPGQVREFTVTDDRKDEVLLSMNIKEKAVIWARMRQLQEEDVTVMGTVVSANRGGLLIEFMTHRGFVPNSHLGIMKDKEDMTGEVLPLKFIEVDEENGRIMFSCRRAQSEDRLSSYRVGDVVEGVVSSVTFYGAFLEIAPNVTGLLHISQISHDRVTNIEKVLSVGDRIKVMIISQDRERGRLALSTRKLEPTPGDMLKDPAVVFARAEEMASLFRIRVAAAEAAARDEEARLSAPVEPAQPEA